MIATRRDDYQFLLGEYQRLYLGHSTRAADRDKASSGGVINTLFRYLLESNQVDVVLGVGYSDSNPIEAEYKAIDKIEDLPSIAGSKYVYMKWRELFEVLKKNEEKRLSVIAQPCHIPLIRKLQKTSMPNIRYVFSFFCGFNMTYDATIYLLKKSKTPFSNVQRIDYRGGRYPGGFTVYRKDGTLSQWNKECYEYTNIAFLHKICRLCRLYFGESADIAFGDAWLREHHKLTSIIARTRLGDELMRDTDSSKLCKLYQLPEKLLIDMHWHNAKIKKVKRTFIYRAATKVLGDIVPHRFAPFFLLKTLSKYRRRMFMGVSCPHLEEVKHD